MNMSMARPVGSLLREWRQRRRLSQLDLACAADISTRHLSFVETGRSAPSREMLLHLGERLQIPLRERNTLLLAGGFAPVYSAKPLEDPSLGAAREAIDLVLAGHAPFPALAVDRHWTLIASNRAIPPLLAGASPSLLKPPINVLRLTLHPEGLAARILNLPEWRSHILTRLRHQFGATADPTLGQLLNELSGYSAQEESANGCPYGGVVVPLTLLTDHGTLSFFSTTTVFGTPLDVTLAELAIESFFPGDVATADVMRRLSAVGDHQAS